MNTRVRWSCASAVLILSLTSCATNTILREDGTSLSAELASVQTQTREFYAKQSAAREDYLLRLIAEDPKCRYDFPMYMVVENAEPNRVRCARDDEILALNEEKPIEAGKAYLYGSPGKSDQAALQLVALVAEYQTVMAKIVEDPKFDSKADLKELVGRADELRERYGSLLKTGSDPRSESLSDDIDVAGALADLIRKAYHDGQTVEKLKALVSREGLAVEVALKSLSLRYQKHDALLLQNLEANSAAARQIEFNKQLAMSSSPADRLKLLRSYSAERKAAAIQLTKTDPLAVALDGLARTHEQFRLALIAGELSEKQRQRIARQTLTNLKTWFNVVKQAAVLL